MYGAGKRKRSRTEQVVPGTLDDNIGQLDIRRRVSNGQASRPNPLDDPDYPIPDFESVYARMRDAESGIQIADRRWGIINYPKCFIGSEAVKWIVDNLAMDMEQAVTLGQRLIDAGIIQHVTNSEPFSNCKFFYRFQEDDDTPILNMKRVWDRTIPTRPAVVVANNLLTQLAMLCEEHRKHILAADRNSPVLSGTPPLNTASPNLLAPNAPRTSDPGQSPFLPSSTLASQPSASSPSLLQSISPTLASSPRLSSAPPTPSITQLDPICDDVDYSVLAKSERFRRYVLSAAELQLVRLESLNNDERIAFFVNIYNTLCLHAHVLHGPPSNWYRRIIFFRTFFYRVGGLDLSLDDVEHGILRGNKRHPMLGIMQQLRASDPKCQHVVTKRDGRIHFVISAGTRSDPPIRIFDGDDVEEELRDATHEFLSHAVKVDVEKRCVTLPRIFSWYAEDFVSPERNLLLWVAGYLPVVTSNGLQSMLNGDGSLPTITYENFDWAKQEARFNAPAVRKKRRRLARERSTPHNVSNGMFLPSQSASGLAPIISPDPFVTGASSVTSNPPSDPHSPATGLTVPVTIGSSETGQFPQRMPSPLAPTNISSRMSDGAQPPVVTQIDVAHVTSPMNMAHNVK